MQAGAHSLHAELVQAQHAIQQIFDRISRFADARAVPLGVGENVVDLVGEHASQRAAKDRRAFRRGRDGGSGAVQILRRRRRRRGRR